MAIKNSPFCLFLSPVTLALLLVMTTISAALALDAKNEKKTSLLP